MLLLWPKSQRVGLARATLNGAETTNGAQASHYALSAPPQQLKGQAVDLVLSNSVVRYLVLPWQDFLWRRADWHALALAQLQKMYGQTNMQHNWHISLNLHRRNQSVLASAISLETMTYLNDLAQTQQFTWRSIAPIGVHLVNQISVARPTWLMIMEPMYVQLLALDIAGLVQATHSAYPIAGQEIAAAQRLLAQALIVPEAHTAAAPKQVLVYVAPNLEGNAFAQPVWPNAAEIEIKWIQPKQANNMTHPQWLAKLKANPS